MIDFTSTRQQLSERMAVRFGATIVANLLRGGFSFVSGILVARYLGASGFGDLNFLLGSFAALSQLLEMGTSPAFYTFISQRRRGRKFFLFYIGWQSVQFLATMLIVGLVLPANVLERIWVGQDRELVLLAFGASFFMTQMWGMVSQLGEATRKTVLVQAAAVFQAVARLVLVAAAVYWNWLTVQTVLGLLIGEYVLLVRVLGPRLAGPNMTHEPGADDEFRVVFREFASYCKPLVGYVWVGFVYTFADRWMLQQFGGAEEQGFFAVSQQFANVSLIATVSILKVFWKEVAEARERRDNARVRMLYSTITRGLYFVAAWISCLLIPYTREIVTGILGSSYELAWFCLVLMFLYPIHQTLGQIQGSFFYASGETTNYARIGLLMMGVSLPITYLLLAGLGLGAVGLAMEMVVLQIVAINLQAFVIARTNGWDYDYGFQGGVLALLLSLGWACKWVSEALFGLAGSFSSPLEALLLGGGLYIALSLTILFHFPSLAGLTDDQIKHMRTVIQRKPSPAVA